MADARSREQLRQEREAFEQAFRHGRAWFNLRLAMGYLGLTIMLAILALAIWVLVNSEAYGPLPIGAAALAMASQALVISYGIVRLVLQQADVVRIEPVTNGATDATPPRRPERRAANPDGPSPAPAGQERPRRRRSGCMFHICSDLWPQASKSRGGPFRGSLHFWVLPARLPSISAPRAPILSRSRGRPIRAHRKAS